MLKLCTHHIDKKTGIIRCLPRATRSVRLTNFMLKLCNYHIDKNTGKKKGKKRAWPLKEELLANFLVNNEDVASHILSFYGIKWGEKDLRNTSKARLLELALQKKVLKKELNKSNGRY